MSLRDTILAADDRKLEAVEVPEWGVTVYVGTMSAAQRIEAESRSDGKSMAELVAIWVAAGTFDDDGKPLFTFDDVPALMDKSVVPLQRIFEPLARLNRLLSSDVEELAKN